MPDTETILTCTKCGNSNQFDTVKTYFHKTILDGSGQVESSRVDSDLEGEELEISCRKCGDPVYFPDSGAPFARQLETHLEKIDEERRQVLEKISTSTEVGLEAGEDLAVATAAITDAIVEIRGKLQEHALYPNLPGRQE